MAEKKKSTLLLLEEDDIPGAKLLKPVEQCGCAVLRRWLLCRGAKTSGKLADLKQRLVEHFEFTNLLLCYRSSRIQVKYHFIASANE